MDEAQASSREHGRGIAMTSSEPAAEAAVRGSAAEGHGDRRRMRVGEQGERLAEAFLIRRGAEVLERNWRSRPSVHGVRGELDLVVRLDDQLVAVEVKTRRGTGYGHPFEAVDAARLHRLHLLLAAWAREHDLGRAARRVDVVAVLLQGPPDRPRVRVEHRIGLH